MRIKRSIYSWLNGVTFSISVWDRQDQRLRVDRSSRGLAPSRLVRMETLWSLRLVLPPMSASMHTCTYRQFRKEERSSWWPTAFVEYVEFLRRVSVLEETWHVSETLKCALLGSWRRFCCRAHFTELCLLTVVSVAALHLFNFLFFVFCFLFVYTRDFPRLFFSLGFSSLVILFI